jgi:hypothetical protein
MVLKEIKLEKNLGNAGAPFLQVWRTKVIMISNNQKFWRKILGILRKEKISD